MQPSSFGHICLACKPLHVFSLALHLAARLFPPLSPEPFEEEVLRSVQMRIWLAGDMNPGSRPLEDQGTDCWRKRAPRLPHGGRTPIHDGFNSATAERPAVFDAAKEGSCPRGFYGRSLRSRYRCRDVSEMQVLSRVTLTCHWMTNASLARSVKGEKLDEGLLSQSRVFVFHSCVIEILCIRS